MRGLCPSLGGLRGVRTQGCTRRGFPRHTACDGSLGRVPGAGRGVSARASRAHGRPAAPAGRGAREWSAQSGREPCPGQGSSLHRYPETSTSANVHACKWGASCGPRGDGHPGTRRGVHEGRWDEGAGEQASRGPRGPGGALADREAAASGSARPAPRAGCRRRAAASASRDGAGAASVLGLRREPAQRTPAGKVTGPRGGAGRPRRPERGAAGRHWALWALGWARGGQGAARVGPPGPSPRHQGTSGCRLTRGCRREGASSGNPSEPTPFAEWVLGEGEDGSGATAAG